MTSGNYSNWAINMRGVDRRRHNRTPHRGDYYMYKGREVEVLMDADSDPTSEVWVCEMNDTNTDHFVKRSELHAA